MRFRRLAIFIRQAFTYLDRYYINSELDEIEDYILEKKGGQRIHGRKPPFRFVAVYELCLLHWKYDVLDTDSRLLTATSILVERHQSGNDVDIELLQMVLDSLFEVSKCEELIRKEGYEFSLQSHGSEPVKAVAFLVENSDWKSILDYRKKIAVELRNR
jgi:hypothetical protein